MCSIVLRTNKPAAMSFRFLMEDLSRTNSFGSGISFSWSLSSTAADASFKFILHISKNGLRTFGTCSPSWLDLFLLFDSIPAVKYIMLRTILISCPHMCPVSWALILAIFPAQRRKWSLHWKGLQLHAVLIDSLLRCPDSRSLKWPAGWKVSAICLGGAACAHN